MAETKNIYKALPMKPPFSIQDQKARLSHTAFTRETRMEAAEMMSHSTPCNDRKDFYSFDTGAINLASRLNRVKARLQKELATVKPTVEPPEQDHSSLIIAEPSDDKKELDALEPTIDEQPEQDCSSLTIAEAPDEALLDLKDDVAYLDQRMARIENSLESSHAYQSRLSTQLDSLSCQIVDLETKLKDRIWTMEREITSFEESRWSAHVPRVLSAMKDLETRVNVLLVLLLGLVLCLAMFVLWVLVYRPSVG
ncbi:hypothetical protein CPB85DRAFT_376770 [Mucidula mucida]|nr:hypothetical protein CPB85DRAFT_376770 [Mucidula mucida]